MLRKELNAARNVTHRNVCRLYDCHWTSKAERPPFLTMELLEGENLAEQLRRTGALVPEQMEPLMAQMLAALEAAHAAGMVHRDFKRANIMLTERSSRVVVIDFGLARQLSAGPGAEPTLGSTALAATPAYMSPEQLRGGPASFASDLYAFGLVAFEMVTGRRRFEADCVLEIASCRLNENPLTTGLSSEPGPPVGVRHPEMSGSRPVAASAVCT